MKSQVAMEYLIIISFALLVLIPSTIYLVNISHEFNDDNSLTVASNSMKKIGQTSDWIYSQGTPAKLKMMVLIPKNVQDIKFSGKTMTWKIKTSAGISEIYYNSLANLTGNITTNLGYYNILIQATTNGVDISVSPG
jgi:hypothetical protein